MSENELRSPRVLVADDEEAIRALVARMLRRAGFEPVEARDGRQAIEALDSNGFDAVVLDLMMPRVDGFGVIAHLIETQPRMMEKTIVMTAFPQTAARERLHHLCCIVSKPFDIEELITLVRNCVNR
jgi:DNA-binding response OmpR family regulator